MIIPLCFALCACLLSGCGNPSEEDAPDSTAPVTTEFAETTAANQTGTTPAELPDGTKTTALPKTEQSDTKPASSADPAGTSSAGTKRNSTTNTETVKAVTTVTTVTEPAGQPGAATELTGDWPIRLPSVRL